MSRNHNLSDPNRTSLSSLSSHPFIYLSLSQTHPRPQSLQPFRDFYQRLLVRRPSAHFSSPCLPLSLLCQPSPEAGLVRGKRVGGKREGNHPARASQPSIFLSAIPFTLSCSPSLSLPPCPLSISVRRPPLSHPLSRSYFYPVFSQGWTCCDGSPFSSAPSSQTNITLLSVLYLLLLCLDRISTRVSDHCIPPRSVFQWPSFL